MWVAACLYLSAVSLLWRAFPTTRQRLAAAGGVLLVIAIGVGLFAVVALAFGSSLGGS
jgi:hypothetical protein